MCSRCDEQFTIHTAKELYFYLDNSAIYTTKGNLLKIWFEREYFTNLIYLEYLATYGRL